MPTAVIALSQFKIVGCLAKDEYEGMDAPWPHGWKELTDQGIEFDVVDIEMSSDAMLDLYQLHFDPVSPIQRLRDSLKDCAIQAQDLQLRRLDALNLTKATEVKDPWFKAVERCEDAIVGAQRLIETLPDV